MGWYTSEQAFACKSATGSTDPLPRMRNASRIGCSERSLAAVAKLYGALQRAGGWRREGGQGKRAQPGTNGMHIGTNEATADAMRMRGMRGGVRVTHSPAPPKAVTAKQV